MMGLGLAIMIGIMDISPALAKRGYDHGRGGYYRNPYVHSRQVYRPYGFSYDYRGRVYAPPPVIYAPPPPPGIGIFFPPIVFPSIIIRP